MILIFEKLLINLFPVISFDIFDTLVERDVPEPTDIFDIVEKSVKPELISDFKIKRIYSERELRHNSKKDVKLYEIYDNFISDYDIKKMYLNQEIVQEIYHCFPKDRYINLFNYAVAKNKTVIITSDMYLPSSTIKSILSKCGINNYNKLYLSNECDRKMKTSGELFSYLINELKINPYRILHFGDSIKSDFLGAIKAHIFPVLIFKKNRIKKLLK